MSRNVNRSQSLSTANARTNREYRYAIDYYKEDGRHLGPIPIEPDFQPARNWAYFTGIRNGKLPPVTAAAEGLVSPLWHEDRGEPICRGIRVETSAVGGEEIVQCDFSRDLFKTLAEKGSSEWLKKGELESGERYTYDVCAYPVTADRSKQAPRTDSTTTPTDFQVEVMPNPIPLASGRLESFRDRITSPATPPITSRAGSNGEAGEGDVPVFLAQTVVDEACTLATEADDREMGGVLVGQIHRDPSNSEIFLEIVAQIPAKYAEASGTSFSFTHETWAAADAAITLRARNELILGWWHSHPLFCNPECPEERQRSCPVASPFFSADDIHLHRVCFPQPYQVALLISDLPTRGRVPALFGWKEGLVSVRDYDAVA